MNLLRTELRRLVARRAALFTLLATVAVCLLSLYGINQEVRSLADAQAEAQQMLDEQHAYWEQQQANPDQTGVDQCLQDQQAERDRSGDQSIDFGCVMPEPTLQDFIYQRPLMEVTEEFLGYLVAPVGFLALVLGATFVAAEFGARSMGTWLTFEPRRSRVFASKVGAAALGALPIALTFAVLGVLGAAALFKLKGAGFELTGDQWRSVTGMALRDVVLIMAASAIGAGLAFLLRHSAAVIGVVAGYLVAVEALVVQLMPSLQQWSLTMNVQAVIRDGYTWTTYRCDDMLGSCTEITHRISFTQGALVTAAVLVATLLLGWLAFRTRDVD